MEAIREETTVDQQECECGNKMFYLYRTYTFGKVVECTKCHKVKKIEMGE